jgi:hypothetical protein
MSLEACRGRRLIKFELRRKFTARRDGRVAEGARLESVYTLTGIGGSNPSLSAIRFNDLANAPQQGVNSQCQTKIVLRCDA